MSVTKSESLSAKRDFGFVKGLIVATLLSMALVVLFAFCLKWFDLADSFIVPVNMLIKALSVVVGTVIFVKKDSSKGLVKGVGFGAIYIVLAFVVFSILSGSFSLQASSLLDLIFASTLGGIVGIVKVNKK